MKLEDRLTKGFGDFLLEKFDKEFKGIDFREVVKEDLFIFAYLGVEYNVYFENPKGTVMLKISATGFEDIGKAARRVDAECKSVVSNKELDTSYWIARRRVLHDGESVEISASLKRKPKSEKMQEFYNMVFNNVLRPVMKGVYIK